jgi:AcrR family transcriptional regulator
MLLHGAPLSNPESRERFGLKTMVRVVARDIGNYTGEPVIETEEMVVSTPTFSFEEYLEVRVFHLLLTIFYYEGNFEEVFGLARQQGVQAFALVARMQAMLDRAPGPFRQLIGNFVRESREELFANREKCLAWARQNFDGLLSGELGGNLLSKYSMLGRFYVTHDALEFLRQALSATTDETLNSGQREEVDEVVEYLRCLLLHAPFGDSLNATPVWRGNFDIETWRKEKYLEPLSTYRYPETVHFATVVEPERKALIENRIRTFGEHPSGLGKFTRTMFARELRRTLVSAPRAEELGGAAFSVPRTGSTETVACGHGAEIQCASSDS